MRGLSARGAHLRRVRLPRRRQSAGPGRQVLVGAEVVVPTSRRRTVDTHKKGRRLNFPLSWRAPDYQADDTFYTFNLK